MPMLSTGCLLAALTVSSTYGSQAPATQPSPAEQSAQDADRADACDPCDDLALSDRPQVLGDAWGAGTALADRGISFDPFLMIDFSRNTRGGLNTEGSAFRHVFSFNATLDFQKLLGLPSGTLFVDFVNQAGQAGSDEVGDYQGVGSYDADGLTQINELWFEYEFLDGLVRTKVGKVDANCEFAYSELNWEFVHGSASYPVTAAVIPTYPDPATSVNVFVYPTDWLSWGFGVYDGALQEGVRTGARGPSTFWNSPADLFVITELGLNWHVTPSGLPGRLGIGGWRHTGAFDRFEGGVDQGTWGFTFVADQMLWLEQPAGDEPAGFDAQGIGAFLQYDTADPHVMPVDQHLGTGLTWRGAVAGRDADLLGLLVSWVHFSDEPAAGFTDSYELATELTYKAWLVGSTAVQPYVQHIINPGGVGLRDAVNVGVRVIVSF